MSLVMDRELVPLARHACHRCGGPIKLTTFTEPALLRHGGYGADRATTFEVCTNRKCKAVRLVEVAEQNPRGT